MNCAEKLLEPTIFFNLYTNELRWKIIRANNLLQLIH